MKYFIPVSDEIPYDDPVLGGEILVPYRIEYSCYRGANRLRNESASVDESPNAEVADDK